MKDPIEELDKVEDPMEMLNTLNFDEYINDFFKTVKDDAMEGDKSCLFSLFGDWF